MTATAAAWRLVGAAVVAGLVRAAWAFGASLAAEVGLPSPLRLAVVPVLLVAAGAGTFAWTRAARADRLVPIVVATAGAAAGLAWARAGWFDGGLALATFLLVATITSVARRAPDPPSRGPGRVLPRGPAPLPDEDPPRLG